MARMFRMMVNGLQKAVPRWAFLLVYGTFAAVKNAYNLLIRYGLMKSAYRWKSVDSAGSPIPWFSYPAVEYLDGLDLSALSVLEFGSGFSTLYWSNRAMSVLSIEDNVEWANRMKPLLGANAQIQVTDSADAYPNAFTGEKAFDIIVVDGSSRLECAKSAIQKINKGGIIILDDADDFSEVSELLRAADLLQVDFAGFSAINTYTKTTSFFFHRTFQPKPLFANLPMHSVCHPNRANQDSSKATLVTR